MHVVLLNMFVEGLGKTMKQCEQHYIKWFLNFIQLYIDFKRTCNLVSRDVLCDFLTEFGIPMELVSLIKIYLHETCSEFQISKFVFLFPFQNALKQGDALLQHVASGRSSKPKQTDTDWDMSVLQMLIDWAKTTSMYYKGEKIVVSSKDGGQNMKLRKVIYLLVTREKNAGQNCNI